MKVADPRVGMVFSVVREKGCRYRMLIALHRRQKALIDVAYKRLAPI